MTSKRQLAANRANARLSTGPRSDAGKLRSRRNAVRHGLAAATVIDVLEDAGDYRRFEAAILADYDPRSTLEHELVVRLVSLLWRLRRVTMIETGLLQIQSESWREGRRSRQGIHACEKGPAATCCGAIVGEHPTFVAPIPNGRDGAPSNSEDTMTDLNTTASVRNMTNTCRDIAGAFFRLTSLNNGVFERIGRYEVALWRHATKTLIVLETLRHRAPVPSQSITRVTGPAGSRQTRAEDAQ
jgi:hypothetical protein